MKRIPIVLAALAIAAAAGATTVVLKGGKRVDVASFEKKGNYVILHLANGRLESYPLDAVDFAATSSANPAANPAPVATPSGPHSPFFGARAKPGGAGVSVTDSDVKHIPTASDEAEAKGEKKADEGSGPAQVVLVSQDRKRLDDGSWEVTATVENQGGTPATGVSANVRLLGPNGEPLASGPSNSLAKLGPKQQGTLSAKLKANADPAQVTFDLQWQTIREAPTPAPAAVAAPAGKPPVNAAAPAQPPVYGVPPGSSPNALPSNPTALPPLTQAPVPPQVQRAAPPKT